MAIFNSYVKLPEGNLNGSKFNMHKELKLEKTRRKKYKRNVQVHGLEGSVSLDFGCQDGLERLEDDFREVGPAHLHDQMGKSVATASCPCSLEV